MDEEMIREANMDEEMIAGYLADCDVYIITTHARIYIGIKALIQR
jgi:hypothetical protein